MANLNERQGASHEDSTKRSQEAPPIPGRPGGFGPGRPGGFGPGRHGSLEKPKNFKSTMLRLWTYFGKERKLLFMIFIFVLFNASLTVLSPFLIGVSIDAIALHDMGLLQIMIIVLAAAYIGEAVLTLLQGWFMAGLSQRVVMKLRESLFNKLQKLPLAFFDARPHGEVMSRLSNDIDNVSNSISQSTIQFMSGSITIVGTFVMMLILSPVLTLAALVTVPLVYVLVRVITKRTSVMFKQQQAELGALNGHIEESITGLQVIKAFNHEEKSIEQFEEVNSRLFKVSLKAQLWSGFMMPLLGVINNIGFATIALVGGILAVNGDITVGVIASFIGYSRQFVRPMNEMAQIYNVLLSGVAGAERAFEVLDEQEEVEDVPGAIELKNPQGHVVFEDVSFGYQADSPILSHVSFTTPQQSSTALVGPTGAGKTTIVNLLTRFYDVTGGRILIDGRDIRQYTRESLRKCFGIVLQDTYLFSGTIKENIKYGKPEATDEEVERAAKLARSDYFIRRLPKQYDTELSENGGNLSQGQRQLLAITRVILAEPSILILDEATSSIDTRTEVHIQAALQQMMQQRTSFIIAHRLNTIRDAHMIMVIDKGQVVEQGSHHELISKQQAYHQMFMNQFKGLEASL